MSPSDVDLYVLERGLEEDAYRFELGIVDTSTSFTYATVTGFNDMEPAETYPGFTYFFKLTPQQVDEILFGVVDGTPKLDLEPQRGLKALERCMTFWIRHRSEFTAVKDDVVGLIEPRIEVIIPCVVTPSAVLPEVEKR